MPSPPALFSKDDLMDLLHEMRIAARNNPWILENVWRIRRHMPAMRYSPRKVVGPGFDAVIEGYPRSGNTFARDAFVASQDRPVNVGNHFHSPAQFALARKYGIPAMLVLRDPVAASLSLVVYDETVYTPEGTLRHYVAFHRPLLAITDSFVVAPFEEVTSDFAKSVERMNRRFGSSFKTFAHTPEAADGILKEMAGRLTAKEAEQGTDLKLRGSYPSALKDHRRKELAAAFETPALERLKAEAQAQYRQLMATL